MDPTTGLRRGTRRALLVTTLLAAGAGAYFLVRGEATSGAIVAALFLAWGYFEYRRRQRDIEAIEGEEEDPLERRTRKR